MSTTATEKDAKWDALVEWDSWIDKMDLERPGYKAAYLAIIAEKESVKAAWKARPVTILSTLPFVGKTYRSRGRRSANKVSAWAVKPPKRTSEAAVLGADYAFQFAAMFQHPENAKFCGTGYFLEAVILGMVDTLAKAAPQDREQHIACIRGFAGVLEAGAGAWLSGGISDSSNAAQHQTRLGHLAGLQQNLRVNNARHRSGKNAAFTQELIRGDQWQTVATKTARATQGVTQAAPFELMA